LLQLHPERPRSHRGSRRILYLEEILLFTGFRISYMKKIIVPVIFIIVLFFPLSLSAQSNTNLYKDTVEQLLGRLNAGVVRVENIAQRISSRHKKMQNFGIATGNLDSQYASLQQQLNKLNLQHGKTQEAAIIFLQSQNPKSDYPAFRNQVTAVVGLIKEALAIESSIITDMKQYSTTTALPTGKVSLTPKL